MLAGAHKKFCRIQQSEIYLLDLKVQYKHRMKLPLDIVSKHVLLYLCLPNYIYTLITYITFSVFINCRQCVDFGVRGRPEYAH